MDIGNKIKSLRKEKNFTLKQLGERIGLSVSFISDIENGRRTPRLENLKKIANGLNVNLSDLLDENKPFILKENSAEYTVDELELEFHRLKPKLKKLSKEQKNKLLKIINIYLEK